MKTYYSDADIEISDEHIKLGNKTVQTSDVESFEVRPMWKYIWLQWRCLPLLIGLLLFALTFVVWAVRGLDYVIGRGELTGPFYAQDWTDFVFPLALLTASLGLILFDDLKLALGVILRGKADKLGSYTTSNPQHLGQITAALSAALVAAKLAIRSNSNRISINEAILYSGASAEVTDDIVVLMGREYRVSDIQEARVWEERGQNTFSLITSLVLPLLIIPTWIPQILPLFSTQPVLAPSGILFPVAWLTAVGYLAFALSIIFSVIRRWLVRFTQPESNLSAYVIMLWGRFGTVNREVIFSIEAYRSLDRAETYKIAEATQQAIARKRLEIGTRPNSKETYQIRKVAIADPGGR